MTMRRQGDLLFIKLDERPHVERRSPTGHVLARGEATGHAHAIRGVSRRFSKVLVDAHGNLVIDVARAEVPVVVSHEEHGSIELEPGYWLVQRQREYAPARPRTVAD